MICNVFSLISHNQKYQMKYLFAFFLLLTSVVTFSQKNSRSLESSFDFGFGNHFGLRQIEEGFNVNSQSVSNLTLGWSNYFTNAKFGGRLELSYDKMMNNSLSNAFETNYFRSTYYLNTSLRNLVGWGNSSRKAVDSKKKWEIFDCDLSMGLGYSIMKSKSYPDSSVTFLTNADDMLNISFRISPSIKISDRIKLFASYTRVNHSAQSNTFDFTKAIDNTAFKGAFRTVNFGIRYTPKPRRTYSRTLKENNKKRHFFTSFDATSGNHFAGKTQLESAKFNRGSIGHLNIGANHMFPNSRLFGRFDLSFDAFKGANGEPAFTSKYFRTTYQVIADMRTFRGWNKGVSNWDLAFGAGLGFATLYNPESQGTMSDIFLDGDDMYALVFSVNPSYRLSKSFSVIANATFTSHSLQTLTWDMQTEQINRSFNGRFMNLSVGLRYHLADRNIRYTSEINDRIPQTWSVDAAIGSHFASSPLADNFALKGTPGKHVAVGLNHPFINPIYFGRFEFAFDALSSNSSSIDFSSNYFRANYFLMTTVQNQLRKSLSSKRPAGKLDVQFGIGVGASTFKGDGISDYFITHGNDVLNLAAKVVPTYKVSEKVSVFAAYTFVSHSLQSLSYDMSQNVNKTMFNGHLMNASVGVSYTFKNTTSLEVAEFIPITPVNPVTKVVVIEPTPEPIVQPITEPVLRTISNRNPIVDYPSQKSELPE